MASWMKKFGLACAALLLLIPIGVSMEWYFISLFLP
ncbi:hypothetical protein EDC32_102333 [Laceyella sacchari]|nr:hypothetical protein EDC32_102333 [Laceyella sacchari]